jgi:hypothetical protein
MLSTASVVPELCAAGSGIWFSAGIFFFYLLHIVQADSGPIKPAAQWTMWLFPLEVSGWGTEEPLTSI